MKRKQMMITDVDHDVLKHIMILVAKSPDGAANLASVLLVCKFFNKLVHDEAVLKAVAFNDLKVLDRLELFQQYNGLLTRCALVGNENAEYLLSKVILLSCSQLLQEEKESIVEPLSDRKHCERVTNYVSGASAFIAHFGINQPTNSKITLGNTNHYQHVRRFLCRCDPDDFCQMYRHIRDYFLNCTRVVDIRLFMDHIINMRESCASLRDLDRIYTIIDSRNKKRILVNQLEPYKIDRNMDKFKIFSRHFHSFTLLSLQLQFECQKRGFNFRLMFHGDLEELEGAQRKFVADFQMYRDRAISVLDSVLL
ncbi:hypothetical protein K2173_028152 [Erythroxylum novogranatense]|uniref:Uncharacterized protein n=1 Tax=Erythroxylum novogranatense TaxID=1862640 RepID=A0AAV8U173_9ROSI|nr:hypothetical protein K2173_028152 [Erythroxylum novogranatense]